jgi:ATP-dependent Clp protease ATP-binding subunit ClpA
MAIETWSARHITSTAQHILKQILSRAADRGLDVADAGSVVLLVLWSLLLWERKAGRVALERLGVDPFDLAREVDRLLVEKAAEAPVACDSQRQGPVIVQVWDFDHLLGPLLQRAEHEALALGHGWVGSEHLLLAVVGLADEGLSAILRQRSVDHGRVSEAVLGVLQA